MARKVVAESEKARIEQLEHEAERVFEKIARQERRIARSKEIEQDKVKASANKVRESYRKQRIPMIDKREALFTELITFIDQLSLLLNRKQFKVLAGRFGLETSTKTHIEGKTPEEVLLWLEENDKKQYIRVKKFLSLVKLKSDRPSDIPGISFVTREQYFTSVLPAHGKNSLRNTRKK